MDLNIYTKEISVDLIPKIKKRFADFHMDISFHPEFRFDEQADTGFLPIKLKVQKGHSKQYDSIGFELVSGFELYFNDYDYEEELKNAQQKVDVTENKSFLSRLFGSGKTVIPEKKHVANVELDQLLSLCEKEITLHFSTQNKSDLRVSLFFAAILAALTDGVVYDPQNGRYLSGQQALQIFPSEIEEYENDFTTAAFTVEKFEAW